MYIYVGTAGDFPFNVSHYVGSKHDASMLTVYNVLLAVSVIVCAARVPSYCGTSKSSCV